MLNNTVPDQSLDVQVRPEPVELVLAEGGSSPLSVVLEPVEDLAEMGALAGRGFSIKDVTLSGLHETEKLFALELTSMESKVERFGGSSVFFNRLANLALAAGKLDSEERFLGRASELSKEAFFTHRRGSNLIAQHRWPEAEELFGKLDLNHDVEANLRLAFFYVQRNEIENASLRVEKALEIDSLDFGARLFQGAVRLIQGKYEMAIHNFRIAAEERPTSSALFCNLALAHAALKQPEKAIVALRRSVALNPLNLTAVILLSDIAYEQKSNEDAVPSLRYYIQFEQKNASVWSRLARALLELGQINEAIEALKRQGSIEKSSALWNNLGVAYFRKNDSKKALESFKKSMEVASESGKFERDFFLPARNAAWIFSQRGMTSDVLKFTRFTIELDQSKMSLRDKELCDLSAFRIHALFKSGKEAIAVLESEKILQENTAARPLVFWIAIELLSWYALNDQPNKALRLANDFGRNLDKIQEPELHLRDRLINNIAFVYADLGETKLAEQFLSKISATIHKDPYATATLGLVHLKKGHIDRAIVLYREAIHIAIKDSDKARIRQKLNYELGQYWRILDTKKSMRYLEKAAAEKNGESGLLNQTTKLLRSIKTSLIENARLK